MSIADQAMAMIEMLDIAVFQVKTESTLSDRTSFLRVQNFARSVFGHYVYLEVGSHIGGSLFPHLIDPACEAAISVDPRPMAQPDERSQVFHYPENSAARMIAVLSDRLPPAAMTKLTTIDSDVSDVRPDAVDSKATLALIDGEHTNRACFSDFVGVLPLMKPDCIVSFHDANLIADAVVNAERFLDHLGIMHETVFLPDTVAVMGLGRLASAVRDQLQPYALDRESYLDRSQRQLWSHITKVHSPKIHAEIERLHSDNSKLIEEIEGMRKTSLDAEARVAAMTSSTTWRASAPIRAVVDRIKRRFAS
ncbi:MULTISPECIES: class I SAM-dependent methyltransferase [unclassified Mesorhizobium]|uniref:class I SAM-dependent methyltransferase n=1 Tax=unclassified Mesorhizobium TaxID=325217 RepID=UPI000FCBCB17|nr:MULTISPECIES: class I SAM-dependent methyltransferase [unclassified Mesorhizobium]RUW36904.1 class I SAM-dependent methyltransferase [Mesorhizobium sp. M1E.F.Ca.ET.041.01.1.1]RUW86090.1 class I SAM-dependent methyltransferase [Mesorhizobium sp. M1E.F.Ca.ET.063.01.1.1]RWD89852.1 MAG: class I SAM-dependent methyltransferase [Mesorhizobium sp.]RWD95902.1 MAG: class I SAM-dependent methyltransferase [Mesorhizobium sp.]TIV55817.1 MAG: class I SAM-dependent methyltransferase [Mesorhizobium sp.]